MPLTLEKFLGELIALMKQDHSRELQKMIKETRGLTWLQTLDGEDALIQVTADDVVIAKKAKPGKIDARVTLSRKTLFDLLEGSITLNDALQGKQVKALGDPVTLLKCYKIWYQILLLARNSPRFYFLTYQLR